MADLFDALCDRWVREAEVLARETGGLPATLVLLPRDVAAEEVAIRLDGLRGNLTERAEAIVAELRPQALPHDPAGLVFLTEVRDGAVVYVTVGVRRRAVGLTIERGLDGVATLRPAEDPPVEAYSWLDGLLEAP